MTTRIAVVTAGLSVPSSTRLLADRISDAVRRRLEGAGETVQVQVIELRDLAQDITNNMLTGFPAGDLRQAIDTVAKADAMVAVTPVFTASYSGLFKSFFDVLDPDALIGTPVLVAATAGTARHSLVLEHALRPLFAYLRAPVVPTAVFAATEDFAGGGTGTGPGVATGLEAGLGDRIERAAGELALMLRGRVVSHGLAGEDGSPRAAADLDEVTPFEQLLGDQLR